MSPTREALIRQRIDEALKPESLELIDDSHMHVGHGAKGGHYTVHIIASAFTGKSMLQRHRLVYASLNDMLNSQIHALTIQSSTPEEQ